MDWEPFLRFLAAAAFAGAIGLDRELRAKPAGFRTNIVVGVAAAAFGWISVEAFNTDASGYDPSRVASQVVSGIGFLGGGAIFSAGTKPHGLTTAAALWGAAASGLAAGLGEYLAGLAMVVVTLLALWPLNLLSERLLLRRARRDAEYEIVADDLQTIAAIQELAREHELRVVQIDLRSFRNEIAVMLIVNGIHGQLRQFTSELDALPGIRFAAEEALALQPN
ncbi:MAG: MgtC/SapB family protein [Nitriliruptorales bacterium]|nr:MgtC/SapB family protein [Nitriliruptorales bacterium]